MKYVSLSQCSKGWLLQTGRSLHWYLRCLKYSSDILKELLFDRLRITNTVRIDKNEFNEFEIPADCYDWCGVGIQMGQYVRPLIQKNTLNRMMNVSTTDGSQITYPDPELNLELGGSIAWIGWNRNSNNEDTGGYYGIGAGAEVDTFTFIEERNCIKVNNDLGVNTIVLCYLSTGAYSNSATLIPAYAEKTITTYIDWNYKLHSKSYGMGDAEQAKRIFDREMEKLAARKNDLTPYDVQRIINRGRRASIQ